MWVAPSDRLKALQGVDWMQISSKAMGSDLTVAIWWL
jgi:hypothetical protein